MGLLEGGGWSRGEVEEIVTGVRRGIAKKLYDRMTDPAPLEVRSKRCISDRFRRPCLPGCRTSEVFIAVEEGQETSNDWSEAALGHCRKNQVPALRQEYLLTLPAARVHTFSSLHSKGEG
jgi:hypothetical protein